MMDDLVSSETPTAVRGREWWDRSTGSDEPRCAEYLESRGVPDVVASQAGVRFSSEWYGRPAVLFPVRDRAGNLIAVCGRFTDGRTDPKTQSAGPKGQGVFATPGALSADVIAVVEGPMDALALWLCGVASVALIGTSWPEWLPQALAFKNVLIATDADDAGNTAANKMKVELEARGAKTFRLRPRIGKDWNESLQLLGAETLRAHLAPFSETADDEMRVNAAWEFDKNGRQGLSGFVASLIKDGMTRETLLMRLRRADVPEAVYGAVETTPVVTFGGDYQRGNPDALLWRFASEHPTVKAMASVFGGLEIIGVQQVSMEVQRAA
jgi:5S rRNA maturation endonuclease (ribonuclease M5)